MNCRNSGPIHRLAARYAKGLESASVLREEGREPELVPAAPGRQTLEALRKVLHRLTVDEGLAPWQIAVLNVDKLIGAQIVEEITGQSRNRVYLAREIVSLLDA